MMERALMIAAVLALACAAVTLGQEAVAGEARFVSCRDSRATWLGSGPGRQGMAECVRDLLAASYPKLRAGRGLSGLDVPPLEPLVVASASVTDSSVFTGTIRNLRVGGLSDAFRKENIQVKPPAEGGVAVVTLRAPKGFTLSGDFDATANILKSILPFYSGPETRVDGLFEGRIDNPVMTIKALYVEDPDKGAAVDGIQLSLDYKESRVTLKNDRLLSGTVLSLLNQLLADPEVSGKVVNQVAPQILKKLEDPAYNMLANGFDEPKEILSRRRRR